MTTLMSLSEEVIDIILSYNDISFEDIINFRCVCKKFRWAATTEEYCFLKKKFFQRWSSAKKYYDEQLEENKQKQSKGNKNKNFTSFIKTGIDCAKQLRNKDMQIFVEKNLKKCNNAGKILLEIDIKIRLNNQDSNNLMLKNKNYIKILFFINEIKHLLDQPVRVNCDLTDRACYIKLFDSLRICWRNDVLNRYIEEQPYKEISEDSAITWAQQLQLDKNISYSSVKTSLKNITLETLNLLREKHPEHSIFSTSYEYIFFCWENHNINNNFWNETEGTQIMDTLQKYMFDKLKFRPSISTELEYFCIDYVLDNKRGTDIILYIIYESVARRLGLRCDLVQSSFEDFSFALIWMPKYIFPTDYKEDIRLLDKECKKNMRSIQVTPAGYNIHVPSVNDNYRSFFCQEVHKTTFTEMLKFLMDIESSFHLYTFPSEILIEEFNYNVPKTRPEDVKFAVGMIVTHSDDDSKDCSTGVIIGWIPFDSYFVRNINEKSFLLMPLRECSYYSEKLTYYYVILNKSDKLCFVKEEDISLTKPKWIRNRNIYHYFSKFEGTHYVPNEKLAKVYPHDAAIAAGTIFKD